MNRFFAGSLPRRFAHRGASADFPENTLAAFRAAEEAGVDGFELDVHRTADGAIVVFHDDTLDRTTDGHGLVAARTIEELRRLDAGHRFTPDGGRTFPFRGRGERIPTLREVCEEFPQMPLIVEIKQVDPPLEQDLARLLQSTGAEDRALVFSLHQEPIDRYRVLRPEQPTGFGPDEVADFVRRLGSDRWEGYRPPGVAFAVPRRWRGTEIVSPPFVEAAHGAGCEVYVWTVNEPVEMRELLELGADGLISDYPERLVEVTAGRGEG